LVPTGIALVTLSESDDGERAWSSASHADDEKSVFSNNLPTPGSTIRNRLIMGYACSFLCTLLSIHVSGPRRAAHFAGFSPGELPGESTCRFLQVPVCGPLALADCRSLLPGITVMPGCTPGRKDLVVRQGAQSERRAGRCRREVVFRGEAGALCWDPSLCQAGRPAQRSASILAQTLSTLEHGKRPGQARHRRSNLTGRSVRALQRDHWDSAFAHRYPETRSRQSALTTPLLQGL
jgi:hypothetical protein